MRVSWEPHEHNLGALLKWLAGEPELRVDRLARAIAEGGAARALRDFIRAHEAAALCDTDWTVAVAQALAVGLKRLVFDSGLTIDRVTGLAFTSETLARQDRLKRETAQRVERIRAREQVEEAAAAAAHKRLDDLGGLLEKLKGAAADDTDLRWHDLLPSLTPGERTRLLENLWRITPDQCIADQIVAVAGHECLWLEPTNPAELGRRVRLADDLGPLRSIRHDADERRLLIGAALGVWVLDADDGGVVECYRAACDKQPRTGFNAAGVVGQLLFATHSELGCWMWPVDEPRGGTALLVPANGVPGAIRALVATNDGRVAFSADAGVHLYTPQTEMTDVLGPFGGTIQSLAVLGTQLYAGTTDGHVLRVDLEPIGGTCVTVHRTFTSIESIHARRWNDLVEVVIPAGDLGVCGVFGEEAAVTRLLDAPMSIRRAWACDDLIVALSERRDRLLVLHAALPGRHVREAPVSRLVGHSIQDACLVTRDVERVGETPA